jgi:hypothetical protein
MTTCVIYVDEAGNPHSHSEPLKVGETPLLTLAAVAFPLREWRARDRAYLQLKRRFFPDIMGKPGRRDEETEIKGKDLTSPHQKTSSRRQAFNHRVLSFIAQYGGQGFGVSFLKSSTSPASSRSLYTQALQILVERFSPFVAEHGTYEHAIMICDSRMKGFGGDDIQVARSHMSYIFGHETGRTFLNIVEAPLFADSRLTVGLQVADIFASNLYANHYQYYLRRIPGALDYSHVQRYWPTLDSLQYKSRNLIDGYQVFGYRIVDQRP